MEMVHLFTLLCPQRFLAGPLLDGLIANGQLLFGSLTQGPQNPAEASKSFLKGSWRSVGK